MLNIYINYLPPWMYRYLAIGDIVIYPPYNTVRSILFTSLTTYHCDLGNLSFSDIILYYFIIHYEI